MTPFLIYRLPGDLLINRCEYTGICNGQLLFENVSVVPWKGVELSENSPMAVCDTSTAAEYYCDSISRLVEKLRVRGGKTVICRQICGKFKALDWASLANEYFGKFPSMFCFLYYHPSTGFWLGASPELLIEASTDGTIKTRALAGTRKSADNEAWSEKNVAEHEIVVGDIVQRIRTVCPSAEIVKSARQDFRYGSIDHLCTPIEVKGVEAGNIDRLVAEIHPTPAVGGYPREEALADIDEFEQTPRNCYGGLISVNTPGGRTVYVVLRCVHFDNEKWAVYSGSGITAASVPADEWKETADKAAPLLELLRKYSK